MKTLREMMDLVESAQAGVAEATGNPGRRLIELFQMIYNNGGDDAVDYLLTNAPIFADYYDRYEGQMQDIATEVGRRDLETMVSELEEVAENEGLAEGVNDTVYPGAEVIKSKNGKPVGEIYQDGNSWGAFHYKADRGYDFIDSREDAVQALKDLHQETGRSRPDYTIKDVAEEQVEESTPDAMAKIDDLFRK